MSIHSAVAAEEDDSDIEECAFTVEPVLRLIPAEARRVHVVASGAFDDNHRGVIEALSSGLGAPRASGDPPEIDQAWRHDTSGPAGVDVRASDAAILESVVRPEDAASDVAVIVRQARPVEDGGLVVVAVYAGKVDSAPLGTVLLRRCAGARGPQRVAQAIRLAAVMEYSARFLGVGAGQDLDGVPQGSFYRGAMLEPVSAAAFYAEVGEPASATRWRHRRALRISLLVVGATANAVGLFTLAAGAFHVGTDRYTCLQESSVGGGGGCAHFGIASTAPALDGVGAGLAVAGLASVIVGAALRVDPTDLAVRRAMAERYNEALRRQLGLSPTVSREQRSQQRLDELAIHLGPRIGPGFAGLSVDGRF